MLRSQRGFTLLEVIAAITVLAVGILTLVYMFSGSINQATQSERYLNGVYLAQQKLSQLEMDDFKSEITEGVFEASEDYHWQLEILPYETSLNNEEARIKVQKVSLRVYWTEGEQEKEVQLVTLNTLGETDTASASELGESSSASPVPPKIPDAPAIKNLNPSQAP